MHNMPYPRFLAWNALASIVWTGAVVSAGYFLGEHADNVVADIGVLVALVIVGVATAALVLRRVAGKRSRSDGSNRAPSSTSPGGRVFGRSSVRHRALVSRDDPSHDRCDGAERDPQA
jgi:hypothetical protein